MNLVLFGPPGAGKGTQSKLMSENLDLVHVSTGDLFRAAIKNKTPLGLKVKKFLDEGNLVPDSMTIDLIKEIVSTKSKGGVLLDGFPRNTSQAEALDHLLSVKKAIFLEVPRDLLMSRLVGRRVCTKCGTTFHVDLNPPKVSGNCSVCGGTLEHRGDDHADVIGNRLDVYDKSTSPLKQYYTHAKKFVSVDGVGDPKDVFERILQVVES